MGGIDLGGRGSEKKIKIMLSYKLAFPKHILLADKGW